jgi:hypothetical protein
MIIKFYKEVGGTFICIKETNTDRTILPHIGQEVIINRETYIVSWSNFDYDRGLISIYL